MWIEEITNSKGKRFKYCERFTAANGKTVKVSVTFNNNNSHTRKTAAAVLRDKFAKKEGRAEEAAKEAAREITFHALCDEWFDVHRQTIKESTAYTQGKLLDKVKAATAPGFMVTDLTADFLARHFSGQYYGQKISYSYLSSQLIMLKQVMKYAAHKGYIDTAAPFVEIKIKRRPATAEELAKKENKFLSRDELRDVLALLRQKSPRIAFVMEFIAHTGLRCGELLALRWQDVDTKKKSINVNATWVKTIKTGEEGKRGTPKNIYSYRNVQLDDRAIKILQWFKADNARLRLWNHNAYTEQGYIFTSCKGTPLSLNVINRVLHGLNYSKHLSSHVFRHTHISLLAEMGVPLKAIMQRVGHHNPNTTLSIYTHVTDAMQEEVVEKLNTMSI